MNKYVANVERWPLGKHPNPYLRWGWQLMHANGGVCTDHRGRAVSGTTATRAGAHRAARKAALEFDTDPNNGWHQIEI